MMRKFWRAATDGQQMQIVGLLTLILGKVDCIMATLQDLQNDVAQETTVEQSVLTLLQGLAAQVAALAPNQAAIDALHASLQQNISTLQAAVTANTPAAPAPPTP